MVLMLGLISEIALGNGPVSGRDEVAMVARIYARAGSGYRSQAALYLCGLHGEHRHKLSMAGPLVYKVMWRDHDRLVWLTGVTEKDGSESNQQDEYNIRTGKLSREKIMAVDGALWDRSEGQFKQGTEAYDSTDKAHPGRFGWTGAHEGWGYTVNGKTTAIGADILSPRGMIFEPAKNRLWYRDWTHNSTDGSWNAVYRFDWVSRKPHLIFDGADSFDFTPDRKIYAAVATRNLATIQGRKRVWVANAWLGNWETGKRWTILNGLAYATSIAIRPGSPPKRIAHLATH